MDSSITTDPSNCTSPSILTYLLSGPLEDFLPYVGQEQSKWLIDIAHDICDPALKRGSLKVWDAAGERLRDVNPTDPLSSSTYLYDILAIVSLTKISPHAGKSKTSASSNASTSTTSTSTSSTSTMAKNVKERDGQQCWVTRSTTPITNSYLFPKQMEDHDLHAIYGAFVSTPPPTLSIQDDICGITLTPNLDALFKMHELGLQLVAPV